MTIRLSPQNAPGAKNIAFHPNPDMGICVRAEFDGLMIIWNGGYAKYQYANLPGGSPRDHLNRILPLRLSRSLMARLAGVMAVDVEFLKR
jgi:hypothetical protein